LDCFEYETIEKLVEKTQLAKVQEYKYNNFYFNVSFPKSLPIRSHSLYIHLKKNFPDVTLYSLYNQSQEPSLEQPHKIFRVIASEILSKVLNKTCHPKSNLSLLLTIGYEYDDAEVEPFKNITSRKSSSKKNRSSELSRNDIFELLKDVSDGSFKSHFAVPPVVPEKEIFLEKIDITADPIYLGGRYLKFQRNVGQTPWVIDGVKIAEHNVQDIIYDAVCDVLGCNRNEMTFTASGREDVDVRMLGSGRPFYIKIDNPRERTVSTDQLLEIERRIIDSKLVAVIKLKSIYVSDTKRIKLGEETKRKTYRALCKTAAPNIKEALDVINRQENLIINQKTCMRVLHRRTLMPREKTIYKLKASEVPGHDDLFEVDLVTQAGTYVKEFIHGDFERTDPSISSLLGYATDLVALDCVDINLIWPEADEDDKINGTHCKPDVK